MYPVVVIAATFTPSDEHVMPFHVLDGDPLRTVKFAPLFVLVYIEPLRAVRNNTDQLEEPATEITCGPPGIIMPPHVAPLSTE